MSQGTAKKLVGQQSSANSAPSVLSTEQEAILQGMKDVLDTMNFSFLLDGASNPTGSGVAVLGHDGTNQQFIKTDTSGQLMVRFDDLLQSLEMLLRQMKNRQELNPYGSLKVELQATGTSPVTITSGSISTMGAAASDQSFMAWTLNNLQFRTSLNQFLY